MWLLSKNPQILGQQSHDNAAIPEKVAYQKSAQDWRETEKIGLNDIILK